MPPIPGGPPQYGPPQYGTPQGGGSLAAAQYANRNAVEVEGAGKNKAQLIVGIDFVSVCDPIAAMCLINRLQGTTFSGVAFAFATNSEAKEDIITEWPGAGSYTKQKVIVAHAIS